MNRIFMFGLFGAALAAGAGATYGNRVGGLHTETSWSAFVNVFALVTTGLCLAFAAIGILRTGDDGIVGVADALIGMAALVALVEIVVHVSFGGWSALPYGTLIVVLSAFALKHQRQAAMAVAFALGACGLSWVLTDPGAVLLGLAPSLLWMVAGGSYAMSMRVGEAVS